MANDRKTFMVEDAKLIFRNFAGRESMYNQQGSRNFAVVLDPETAQLMARDGWNVKFPEPNDDPEADTKDPYIQVAVKFDILPPKIFLITSSGRTQLTESTVEVLDYADIRTADLVANASFWTVNGKSGIKAYLKTLFVTIEEDELEKKYAAMQEPME